MKFNGNIRVDVLSALEANFFYPQVKTTGIRIWNGESSQNKDYRGALRASSLWIDIKDYVFDDIFRLSPEEMQEASENKEHECFDPNYFSYELGKKIVEDFDSIRRSISGLMVHCTHGKSRSPAVALALNDRFDLGIERERFLLSFPKINKTIYEMIACRSLC